MRAGWRTSRRAKSLRSASPLAICGDGRRGRPGERAPGRVRLAVRRPATTIVPAPMSQWTDGACVSFCEQEPGRAGRPRRPPSARRPPRGAEHVRRVQRHPHVHERVRAGAVAAVDHADGDQRRPEHQDELQVARRQPAGEADQEDRRDEGQPDRDQQARLGRVASCAGAAARCRPATRPLRTGTRDRATSWPVRP